MRPGWMLKSSGCARRWKQQVAIRQVPKIRDLRDMLTLLRHRQLKPDKGRRKDLKKIESVVERFSHAY